MIKLLTREGMFCLLRGEQGQHRDVHKHLFGQLSQQLPNFGLSFDAVQALKVRIDDPQANGHRIVSTPFNMRLRVSPFVCREDVQDLLNLPIRRCIAIDPSHDDHRPSDHVMISTAASKKAFASCIPIVPAAYRMSVD
jgi:hypothetical protein